MENNKKQKSPSLMMTEVDRLSDLPWDILNRILSLLPIKDLVKTSLLSAKWRNKWKNVSTLIFNDQTFPPSVSDDGSAMVDKLGRDINHILELHSGILQKFELNYEKSIPEDKAAELIQYLPRGYLNEIHLGVNDEKCYDLSSCLYSFQNLTHLTLRGYWLPPLPRSSTGFRRLRSLDLQVFNGPYDVLESLIHNSPVLENLTLCDSTLHFCNIDSTSLQVIKMDEIYDNESISIQCTNLVDLYLKYHGDYEDEDEEEDVVQVIDIVELMDGVPQITSLTLMGRSIVLAYDVIPRELPRPCLKLLSLKVEIDLSCVSETLALDVLLRIVPNLTELHIHLSDVVTNLPGTYEWEAEQRSRQFAKLQRVRITGYCPGVKPVADFIGFILLTAPILKSMVVEFCKIDSFVSDLEIMRRVCSFRRASTLAQVFFRKITLAQIFNKLTL